MIWAKAPRWRCSPKASFWRLLHISNPSSKALTDGIMHTDDPFFNFTRARFLRNEKEEMRRRHIEFDVKELMLAAAVATKSRSCTSIEKFPDGMYNKAFRLSMDDGRQFVAKLPNPNAGLPCYTTASEVATMDFMRTVLKTPVPVVHAWCSEASQTPVKAEYIIMDMARGVQLETLWPKMKFERKVALLKDLSRYRSAWASASFKKYGSLYYTQDSKEQPSKLFDCATTAQDDNRQDFKVARFKVGPATGREWINNGRNNIECDRGPWQNLDQRQRAIGLREEACISQLDKLPLSPVAIYGPSLYRPTRAKKLKALNYYFRILEHLLPTDKDICKPSISHGDLHLENIYVDPDNPTQITDLIDWQCTEVEPLFNATYQPYLLDHDGPLITGMTRPKLPDISEMDPVAERQARRLTYHQNLEYAWKMLMQHSSPSIFRAMLFREDKYAFQALTMPHHLLQEGEVQYLGILLELEKIWSELPQVVAARSKGEGKTINFPLDFSEAERAAIEKDGEASWQGIQLLRDVRGAMGHLAPGKQGEVRHEYYNEARSALEQLKQQVIASHAKTEEEAAVWRETWPFDAD